MMPTLALTIGEPAGIGPDLWNATQGVLNAAVAKFGCPMASPFMSLSFISLPTVPQLGLTDCGLIDVLGHKITDVVLETE